MSKLFTAAREFAKLAESQGDPLAGDRLHSLLLCAQAWSRIIRERDLFWEEFSEGTEEPQIPELSAILDQAGILPDGPPLSEDEADFVGASWACYGAHAAPALARVIREERLWDAYRSPQTWTKPPLPHALEAYRARLQAREQEARRQIAASGFDPATFIAWARKPAREGA